MAHADCDKQMTAFSWSPPTACILPFPILRRRAFIRRQIEMLARLKPIGTERQLRATLDLQRTTMLKKGISEAHIAAEVAALEDAVRSALVGPSRGGATR